MNQKPPHLRRTKKFMLRYTDDEMVRFRRRAGKKNLSAYLREISLGELHKKRKK